MIAASAGGHQAQKNRLCGKGGSCCLFGNIQIWLAGLPNTLWGLPLSF
ncbi:hypothetical protein [uncultured Psychrobacter sp.]